MVRVQWATESEVRNHFSNLFALNPEVQERAEEQRRHATAAASAARHRGRRYRPSNNKRAVFAGGVGSNGDVDSPLANPGAVPSGAWRRTVMSWSQAS